MKHSNSLMSHREVVFVRARIGSGNGSDAYKSFAIDPNITTFNVFLGILSRCFDTMSDFSVSYLASDDYGEQFYVPMQSDWDLDAAVLTSSDPFLSVKLNIKPLPAELRDWDVVVPGDVRFGIRTSNSLQNTLPSRNSTARMSYHAVTLLSFVSDRIGKTVNNVQKVIGLKADPELDASHLTKLPMTDVEFRLYLDNVGCVTRLEQLCWDIYRGGLQPELRKVGWRILLSVFPSDTTGQERISLLETKTRQYLAMKETWKRAYVQGQLTEKQLATLASVSIDVVRTDWTNDYYCGEKNRYRVCQLFDLLATYSIYHPSVGYSQGMSDLASSLLIVQEDEVAGYLCFCALMQRLHANFSHTHPSGILAKMDHLYSLLVHKDPKLACFLRMHGLADMYFTQRWLLLELKREFVFEDSLHLFEIQWAASNSIRLADATNLEQASNSKTVGHLVLAEEKTIIFPSEPLETTDKSHSLKRYGVRDVSLINSLIGSDYVVQLTDSNGNKLKRLAFSDVARRPKATSQSRGSTVGHVHSLDLGSICPTDFNFPLRNSQNRRSFQPNTNQSAFRLDQDSSSVCGLERSQTGSGTRNAKPIVQPKCSSIPETGLFSQHQVTESQLPRPEELGYGNPFLLFLCFSLLVEYREDIFARVRDAGDMIAFFQQQSKKHKLTRIVQRARTHFNNYLQDHNLYLP